ncbi:hypothetical protein Tco_1503885 [Tanacetum coccineum]
MKGPSFEIFMQRLWDSLISYNDVHTTMMFYPKKRDTGPKAVFFPQASPKDVYEYFIHGLVDSLYFHGKQSKRNTKEFHRSSKGSSKIGTGPGRTEKVRINYYSKNFLIYSHFQEKINEVQMKALADFEDQFENFSGLLAPLPEDTKQLYADLYKNTNSN